MSNETSIFINGKRFILLDDDPPSSCHIGPNTTNVATYAEPVEVSSDEKPSVTMECSPLEVLEHDDTSGTCGSYGLHPPAEFIYSLEVRGAAYKYASTMGQVKLCNPPDSSASQSTSATLHLALLGGEVATGCDDLTTFRMAEVPGADLVSP
jgi:hypothetical protein